MNDGGQRRSLLASARSSIAPWAISRLVVLLGLLSAHELVSHGHLARAGATQRVHQGLLAWDAGWYEAIARQGYVHLGAQATRFFPLWPLMVRGLHHLGLPVAGVMIVTVSVVWFMALIAIDQLGAASGFSRRATGASLWLVCLAPGAVATVLGYAEPLLVLLVATTLTLALRVHTTRPAAPLWAGAAVLGFAAGLTRPVGVVLCVPVGIEAWRRRNAGAIPVSVLATVAPLGGLVSYLWWCHATFNSWLLPLRVQTESVHHGGLTNPVSGLLHAASLALHGHTSVWMHLPWVALAIIGCVLSFKRAPLSLAIYSTLIVALALSGSNLDSLELYLLAAPTLFAVAGTFLDRQRLRILVYVGLGVVLFGTSTLVFANAIVP